MGKGLNNYTFGVDGLDSLLRGALSSGTLVVVAGHPGSGKTTLASTICYHNALKGYKCLYTSVQEDREKLFKNMKSLGLDLESAERKGYLKFLHLPLTASENTVSSVIIEVLNKSIEEFSPNVIIVDSVTPILKSLGSEIKARAVLQNYFTGLSRLISGVVVLIAEIPLSEERIELGDIEFVSDVIIVLRHSVVRRLLLRELEVRKARGAPVSVAKVVFTITEGFGFKVFTPPALSEIPAPALERPLETMGCRTIDRRIGPLYRGELVYVKSPGLHFHYYVLAYALLSALHNKGKLLIVSYESSPAYIWYQLSEMMKDMFRIEIKPSKLESVLGEFIKIEAYNPAAYLPEDLYQKAIVLADHYKPMVMLFLGNPIGDVTPGDLRLREYKDILINLLLHLKSRKLIGIVIETGTSEFSSVMSSIADIIVTINPKDTAGPLSVEFTISRRIRSPYTIGEKELRSCLDEISDFLLKLSLT
ncbi:MAG: ATPase domain-containing protein [Sulfolobales archaeon]